MRKFAYIVLGFLAAFALTMPFMSYALSTFIVPQGGTGDSTFTSSNLLYGAGVNSIKTVATTSVTCSGSTSCTSFTAIGNSPITITSSGGGSPYPFTPSTFGSTNTSATSTAINDTGGLISTASSTLQKLTIELSTTTAATTTDFKATRWTLGTATGLDLLTSGVGSVYAGSNPCSGTQAALSLSASGVITCTNIPQGTVTSITAGTGLSGGAITTSGTVALLSYLATSSAETATRIPTWNSTSGTPAQLTGGFSGFTINALGTLLTATNASTTALSATGFLGIPNGSPITVTAAGQVAANTSVASSSLQYYDGTAQRGLYNLTPRGVSFLNPAGYSATTTIAIPSGPRGTTLTQGYCQSAGGGSFTGVFGKGSATSTYMQSSNSGGNPTITTLSSNNTLEAFQTYYVQVGSWSQTTATTTGSCVWSGYYTY